MNQLVRAELLKMRTTRVFAATALAALAFIPLTIAVAVLTAGKPGGTPAFETHEGVRHVLSASSAGTVVVLLIGILLMAGEHRHGTATATFLVTPDRKRVVGAKLIAATIAGAAVAVVSSVLTLAIVIPWLAAKDVHVDLLGSDVVLVLLGGFVATCLYAPIGVGLATMIRNQTTAQGVALVWTLVVEGLVVSLVPTLGRWLPGGAATALTYAAVNDVKLLPAWAAGLLFAAYAFAFGAAGIALIQRRDIT
ncbi:MAG: ABC transporter permease [Actinobacteria bacterium]|nr:ABC transporter permease [Actinomycetota bacterium]